MALDLTKVPALNANDATFIQAWRALAMLWNGPACDGKSMEELAAIGELVEAFEAESKKRGFKDSEILKGCY